MKQKERNIPPKGPSDPPECSNLQPLAHCWALPAASSLQVNALAPCCARTELCADRYWSISLPEVDPLEPVEEAFGAEEEVVDAGAFDEEDEDFFSSVLAGAVLEVFSDEDVEEEVGLLEEEELELEVAGLMDLEEELVAIVDASEEVVEDTKEDVLEPGEVRIVLCAVVVIALALAD